MKRLDIFSRLLEGTMVTDKTGATTYVNNEPDSNSIRRDPNVKTATTTQGRKLKEQELDEMARIPSKYSLTDDWKAKFNDAPEKVQKNKTINFILNFAGENPEWQILDIAKAYGESKGDPKFGRQQMFNPLVKDILEPLGIIKPVSGEALTKPRKSFADEEDSVERDLADRDAAADRDLSQYFDVSKGKDKDEFEEEPEIEEPNLPKQQYNAPTSAATKAAEFLYDNDRLLQKLINLTAQSRVKVRRAPISENEVTDNKFYNQEKSRVENSKSNLDILIDEYIVKIKEQEPDVQREIIRMLEGKLAPLNMANLFNKIKNALGNIPFKSNIPKFEDDLDDLEFDEDDIEYEPLDEWTRKQFQIRAGIIR